MIKSHRSQIARFFCAAFTVMLASAANGEPLQRPFGSGQGQDRFDRAEQVVLPALGPLAKWLVIGPSGAWDHRVESGAYILSNSQAPGAVRYFADHLPGAAKIKVTATLEIAADRTETAGAGLIYGFDRPAQTYVAVTIQGNDTVATYIRDGKVLRETMRSSATGLIKPGINELTILGTRNTIAVLVNGQPVGSLTNDLLTTTKGAGILALGRGTFTFRTYSVQAVQ